MAAAFDDSHLFEFTTYDDYLNSFITTADMRNLQNDKIARMIAMLGYRSPSETLSREQFEHRKAVAIELNFPKRKSHKPYCEGLKTDDNILLALAERERAIRVGLLSVNLFKFETTISSVHTITCFLPIPLCHFRLLYSFVITSRRGLRYPVSSIYNTASKEPVPVSRIVSIGFRFSLVRSAYSPLNMIWVISIGKKITA